MEQAVFLTCALDALRMLDQKQTSVQPQEERREGGSGSQLHSLSTTANVLLWARLLSGVVVAGALLPPLEEPLLPPIWAKTPAAPASGQKQQLPPQVWQRRQSVRGGGGGGGGASASVALAAAAPDAAPSHAFRPLCDRTLRDPPGVGLWQRQQQQ